MGELKILIAADKYKEPGRLSVKIYDNQSQNTGPDESIGLKNTAIESIGIGSA